MLRFDPSESAKTNPVLSDFCLHLRPDVLYISTLMSQGQVKMAKCIVFKLSYGAIYGKVETELSFEWGVNKSLPSPSKKKSPCKRTSFCSWKNGEKMLLYCKAASLLYCSSWVMKVQRGNPKCVWGSLKQTGWQIAFKPAFTLFPLFLFIAMVNPPAPLL